MEFSKKILKAVSLSLLLCFEAYPHSADEIAFSALLAIKQLAEINPVVMEGIKTGIVATTAALVGAPVAETIANALGIENWFGITTKPIISATELSTRAQEIASRGTTTTKTSSYTADFTKFEQEFKTPPHQTLWNPQNKECKKALEAYDHYSNPAFIAWIREAPGYQENISNLRYEIDKKNSKIRERLKHVPGFDSHTKYWWAFGAIGSHKSHYGFHDFIRAEDDRIKKERAAKEEPARAMRIRDEAIQNEQKAYHQQELARAEQVKNEMFLQQTAWINHELSERTRYQGILYEEVAQSERHEKLLENFQEDQDVQNENFETISSPHLVALSEGFAVCHSPENKIYSDLGFHFLQDAQEYYDMHNASRYEMSKRRAEALLLTIENNESVSTQRHTLSEFSNYALTSRHFSSSNYEYFSGTTITHCIHNEFIHTLNESSLLAHSFNNNNTLSRITDVIFESLEAGRATNDGSNLQHSFALSDWCSSLLNVGKQCALIISDDITTSLNAASANLIETANTFVATGKGALYGAHTFGRTWADFLEKAATSPSCIIEDYKRTITDATLALSRVVLYAWNDPIEFTNKAVTLTSLLAQKITTNPDSTIEKITTFLSEALLNHRVNPEIYSNFSTLAKALKAEFDIAKKVIQESNTVKQLTIPLTNIAKNTAKIIDIAAQQGKEVGQSVVNFLDKNKLLTDQENFCLNKLEQIFKNEKKSYWKELIKDPAHNNKINVKSFNEGVIGILAENSGLLKGPIKRDLSGASEFIDILGNCWDVKSVVSKTPTGKNIFNLEKIINSIKRDLNLGENIILDLTKAERNDLINLITNLNLSLTEKQIKRVITVSQLDF